uniref:Uncharacterized protein n=1 Tax=Glossina austeni TaxID=7395 RepID=A0A1A9VME3_GLOAU
MQKNVMHRVWQICLGDAFQHDENGNQCDQCHKLYVEMLNVYGELPLKEIKNYKLVFFHQLNFFKHFAKAPDQGVRYLKEQSVTLVKTLYGQQTNYCTRTCQALCKEKLNATGRFAISKTQIVVLRIMLHAMHIISVMTK